jgi:hypothetical protein
VVYSAEYDLHYLQASSDGLEAYLFANQLYWPLGASPPAGEAPYPPLTLDNLLLSQARLKARRLSKSQQAELARLAGSLDLLRSKWRSAWGRKAQHEFRARLNLWRNYLSEYQQDPDGQADRYPYEVRQRVMLQLLEDEVDEIPSAEAELLRLLDQHLRAWLAPGQFVWEADLINVFTQEHYWYLHGILPARLPEV